MGGLAFTEANPDAGAPWTGTRGDSGNSELTVGASIITNIPN